MGIYLRFPNVLRSLQTEKRANFRIAFRYISKRQRNIVLCSCRIYVEDTDYGQAVNRCFNHFKAGIRPYLDLLTFEEVGDVLQLGDVVLGVSALLAHEVEHPAVGLGRPARQQLHHLHEDRAPRRHLRRRVHDARDRVAAERGEVL